ncbi:MAG: hypothetical protein GY874_20945 [Desulfobacteraceae bacterium]|nr:hypothetical protein [Desulfobacteraceae bacterium]
MPKGILLLRASARSNLTDWLFSILPIITGLLGSQILGTLFVWQSNLHLKRSLEAVTDSGWLAIPTGTAAAGLTSLKNAIAAGLFYALSVGAGLTLLTWAVLKLHTRLSGKNRNPLIFMALIWLGLIVAVNLKGFTIYPSLFVVITPAVTALAHYFTKPETNHKRDKSAWWLPVVVLLLLTALWFTQISNNLFIIVRDHLLLSNSLGRSINGYYYRHTLHAAEAFKSFRQKFQKTCRLEIAKEDKNALRLKRLLTNRQILELTSSRADMPVDIQVKLTKNEIVLTPARGQPLVVDAKAFFKNPGSWFRRFSDQNDRLSIFRKIIFAGLLIGFPCLLYLAFYGFLSTIIRIWVYPDKTIKVTSCLCLIIGIALFVPVLGGVQADFPKHHIEKILHNSNWPEKVRALRQIENQKLEIADYPSYKTLLKSGQVVERYWLARALAISRNANTYQDLSILTADSHPNVVCQAFYALSRRKNPIGIKIIQNKLTSTGHWYVQWYGYNAMKGLGWRQKKSN